MRITSLDLARTIGRHTGLNQKKALRTISRMFELIASSLVAGEEARLSGFGKFYTTVRNERSGRHPATGKALVIPAGRTLRFKAFKRLKSTLNGTFPGTQHLADKASVPLNRRREPRVDSLPQGRAVVRISGIPVCEFDIKDLSGNGTCILVEENSMVLRNITIGQKIELSIAYPEATRKVLMQRSAIVHITRPDGNSPYCGYVLVGVRILDGEPGINCFDDAIMR